MKIEIKVLNKEFYNQIFMGKREGFTEDFIRENCDKHPLPSYATIGSAAVDLCCTEDITIYPGETKMINTGLAIHIGSAKSSTNDWNDPERLAGIILPRSGLGTKGLVLANTIGLIDEDYKSDLKIAAWNRNSTNYEWKVGEDPEIIQLKAGDRIAQLIFIPVVKCSWDVVEEFSDSTITRGGFGSTGA